MFSLYTFKILLDLNNFLVSWYLNDAKPVLFLTVYIFQLYNCEYTSSKVMIMTLQLKIVFCLRNRQNIFAILVSIDLNCRFELRILSKKLLRKFIPKAPVISPLFVLMENNLFSYVSWEKDYLVFFPLRQILVRYKPFTDAL